MRLGDRPLSLLTRVSWPFQTGALDPHYVRTSYFLGLAHQHKGLSEKAVKYLERGATLSGRDQVFLAALPRLALHDFALTMLGVHLMDRADFDDLAAAAAERNRWEFMLTIAPLPIPHGTGTPVNPIAVF